jgi:TolA-binding protein
MKQSLHLLGIAAATVAAIQLAGCSSSRETDTSPSTQPGVIEVMQKEVAAVRSENVQLKQQATKLEQENRNATARIAELETQLADIKERTARPTLPPKPNLGDVRSAYDQALQAFRSRNYQEATDILNTLLEASVPEELEDNCHYWLGESAYGMKQYTRAIEHFQHVFSYKISEKKDDAQIMIANSYAAMGNTQRAQEEYQKLLDNFPASPYVPIAKEKLAGK